MNEPGGTPSTAPVRCRVCKRILKNPVSIQLGTGPICRKCDALQREFDFMQSQFAVIRHEKGSYIYIRDTGGNSGYKTVTNDAPKVLARLFNEEHITETTRIFYDDSMGRIDELLHENKTFTGYLAGHEGIDLPEAEHPVQE